LVSGAAGPSTTHQLDALARRYGLPDAAGEQLRCLLTHLVNDPVAPTAVRDPGKVADDHLADSLVALELEEVRRAREVVDIGAGAGLPGLPLAIARPDGCFVLLESAGRKCAYLSEVVGRCAIVNAAVVQARAESWRAGLEAFDLATARALAPLPVVLEYAAPLLRVGGAAVVWRGRRDPVSEAAAERAASQLGLEPGPVQHVMPYTGAEHRHLHLWLKVRPTPYRFPRRPGVALKRPLGGG
jgi:16S rRNA (guanine527-N7)-methyltransferase